MSQYNTIFNQMLHLIPRHRFETLVASHQADRYVKHLTSWRQFTTLLYAQISGKDSLREIEQGLQVNESRIYHLGLTRIKRSTLADANNRRSHEIFEGLFYRVLERCQNITPKHKFRFKNPLFTFDSTLIELCLSVFPWAKYRFSKGAVKLHYQFNHAGCIPEFLIITGADANDMKVAKKFFHIQPDSIYCLDRGYVDFSLFRRIHDRKSFFVTRAKTGINCTVIGQHSEPNKKGVLADHLIKFNIYESRKDINFPVRLIRYYDSQTDKELTFLTNNLHLSAFTIAQIYKARWQVEIFFKWIKQNLKIKNFLGTSHNAVLTQIWVAMLYYLLLAYIKFQSRYQRSLFYLHRVIRDTLLTKNTLLDLLRANERIISKLQRDDPQLSFF